jgi:hypothetical protein
VAGEDPFTEIRMVEFFRKQYKEGRGVFWLKKITPIFTLLSSFRMDHKGLAYSYFNPTVV